MVLLPPASYARRPASLPCQSAKQLGQVQTSPVSRHQAPSPHLHPGPWVLPVPHVASDFAHQRWGVQGPASHQRWESAPSPVCTPSQSV